MKALRWPESWLFPLSVLVFLLWPELDLSLSAHFWQPEQGFYLKQARWAWWTFELFAQIPRILAVLLLMGWLLSFIREPLKNHRPALAFLLFSLLLGPGLLVNEVFKSHYGRARPSQVEAFGGDRQFTPPTRPARQCEKNCAFVSGHAAGAFWLMALAWITGRRRWLLPGLLLGLWVGFVRVVQGGHFPSDVLFAGWVVWFSLRLNARWWLHRWQIHPPSAD